MISLLLMLACSGDEPQDTGPVDTGNGLPEFCPDAPEPEVRFDVQSGGSAGRYLVMHPRLDAEEAPLVVFLPGYAGTLQDAETTWGAFLDDEPKEFRFVMPYVEVEGYPDVDLPVAELIDEAQACWGTESTIVHLVGHESGGVLAYNTVGPALVDRFSSIIGTPAYFGEMDLSVFQGVAFLHATGANDKTWARQMEQAHARLEKAGIESELILYEGQGILPNPNWFGLDDFRSFWREHD